MATIVTKNSSTASAVPTTSDLVQGELAVNVTDKRIFTENASTQIVELGTNPSTVTTATATVTGTLTANGTFASSNAVITGGSINSTPIGATTPSTIVGSTVTANTGFVGGLTGNVTGNLTGNVTGNVNGNLTGNVTGNVTASSGTTTLNDLVVNGTADFTNTKLTNITTPTVGTDAANKSYVDDTVAAVIDSAPAALDTLNELAAALGDDANFAGTVTTALATKLPLAGGTMTGAIAMGTSKITGLGNPTSAQDAATKTYVDTADALKLNLTGGTMSGAIAMGTNKITGVGNPTLAQDAATKDYVDDILGSATSAATSAAAASTSASNAATSASNAASSATASANSASAAAASYDAFDDRYLGDKASDPTLDNDGNALLTGALYFNTTSDVMKVYDGSAWNIAAISSASPTFTGTVTADGLSLGDNDKATFGNSNDLEIYHDGSNSWITDVGTGDLIIQGSNAIRLRSATGENMGFFNADGAATLYHDNSPKLATTATGIDVTGTATTDGLTVAGTSTFVVSDTGKVKITHATRGDSDLNFIPAGATADSLALRAGTNLLQRWSANGDISLYEDTGTTPKFFWDASAESLGIGTSSPTATTGLHIQGSDGASGSTVNVSGNEFFIDNNGDTGMTLGSSNTGTGGYVFADSNVALRAGMFYTHSTDQMSFRVASQTRVSIDSSGNVGIGTTSPFPFSSAQAGLTLSGTSGSFPTRAGALSFISQDTTSTECHIHARDAYMAFETGTSATSTERMRIDSSGNVGIGVVPSAWSVGSGILQISNAGIVGTGSASEFSNNRYYDGTNNIYLANGYALRYQQNTGAGHHSWLTSATGTAGGTITFTERMRLDASGNLFVGRTTDANTNGLSLLSSGFFRASTTSTTTGVFNRNTSDGVILAFSKDGTTVGSIATLTGALQISGNTNSGLQFNLSSFIPLQNGATIDATIDLGSSPRRFKDLYLSGTVYGGGAFSAGTTGSGVFFAEGAAHIFRRGSAGSYQEFGRFDTSGNLLVGKTVTDDFTVVGTQIDADGFIGVTRDGSVAALFNRKTSDGDIAQFRKDNTTVGIIGTQSGRLVIGSGDTGLRMAADVNNIVPWNTTTNLLSDAAIDLGGTTQRFKDLYLSGGVYLGGTVAANKLDDYEEGTWTPAFTNLTIGNGTQSHIYTKVGNKVTLEGTITLGSTSSISGALNDASVPFTANTTQRAFNKCYFLDNGTANYVGTAVVNDLNVLQLLADNAASTYLTFSNLSSTVPFTWTSTDIIRYSITYITT
jgi:hypothetical protein